MLSSCFEARLKRFSVEKCYSFKKNRKETPDFLHCDFKFAGLRNYNGTEPILPLKLQQGNRM